ncbi:MAG: hypothetical protein KKA84_09970 [Bacteroidetes bacterium]|nr:hypothetical protein [Bacteroidota bacterium]
MKKVLLFLLIPFTLMMAQDFNHRPATGLFMSVGVGPRFPVGDFSENQNIGIGLDLELAYTNTNFLPVFVFGNLGYMNFPGKQGFYRDSEYSSLTTNILGVNGGARYYLPPFIDDIVLLMPVLEVSASIAYLEKGHVFKIDAGKANFTENNFKTGFKISAGFSMFIMDVMASYNYLHNNQFVALDMKVRIPIFVEM